MTLLLSPLHNRSHTRTLAALAALLLSLLLAACAPGSDDAADEVGPETVTTAELPDWLDKVYPPPDSETSATRAVQVNHNAIAADQQVRLVIDGTDVTSYAVATTPGLLEYDMDQTVAPVELDPGQHTAVVELKRVTPGASEGVDSYDADVHETIESFTWNFTVL